jgi:hypothetical protein
MKATEAQPIVDGGMRMAELKQAGVYQSAIRIPPSAFD